jgi:membrane protease YdiL (CAAX protease family)
MNLFDSMPPLQGSLLKAALPLLAIGIVVLNLKRRHYSLREYLGLIPPRASQVALWMALYLGWMLLTNLIMSWRGPWDFSRWANSPMIVNVLRVLGVSILGPIAEELIFRGVLYYRLSRTGLGPVVAIVVLTAAWALLHFSYSPAVIAVIFISGLILGFARWQSGSVILSILMHIAWNLYAVW